jgi:hypothetical protein
MHTDRKTPPTTTPAAAAAATTTAAAAAAADARVAAVAEEAEAREKEMADGIASVRAELEALKALKSSAQQVGKRERERERDSLSFVLSFCSDSAVNDRCPPPCVCSQAQDEEIERLRKEKEAAARQVSAQQETIAKLEAER